MVPLHRRKGTSLLLRLQAKHVDEVFITVVADGPEIVLFAVGLSLSLDDVSKFVVVDKGLGSSLGRLLLLLKLISLSIPVADVKDFCYALRDAVSLLQATLLVSLAHVCLIEVFHHLI